MAVLPIGGGGAGDAVAAVAAAAMPATPSRRGRGARGRRWALLAAATTLAMPPCARGFALAPQVSNTRRARLLWVLCSV